MNQRQVWLLLHARNVEHQRMIDRLPRLSKDERKIVRESKKNGIKHDGAW